MEKNYSKKSHTVFSKIPITVLNAINTFWKHCINETFFLEIFIHCALQCISKQWKNVPKAIIDFRDMEKNTHTKEFEKSCTMLFYFARGLFETLSLVNQPLLILPCKCLPNIRAQKIAQSAEYAQMWPKVPNKSTRAFVGVPTCFLVFLKGL